ncbi:MAG: hypothetical protein JWR26_1378 [Pedosphaera sp.]|nr:hypothetical protein [Pedosphaera sp.]
MENPSCIIDLINDGPYGLRLVLEPEGAEFLLPASESIQIHVFGNKSPVTVKQSMGENATGIISFWPDKGNYELFYKGQRVWDLL